MKIDILTIFPNIFAPLQESIIKKAQEKGLVEINIHDLRDWATDKHKSVDSPQYGGGAGMVIRVDVVDLALREIKSKASVSTHHPPHTILLSPQGQLFTQQKAESLSNHKHLILIAGHYEGFDQRIVEHLIDEEISIGDYVLTGGELPAMVITDAVVRLIPGVLGSAESLRDETHSTPGKKKYPVYTKPSTYNDWKVPEVLLSGDHKKISEWRDKN